MAAEWIDSFQGDLSLWWFWQLCFCSVWGRCPAERGEQTQRYTQLSAQLSARPCSLGWSCYHTTLRCTESVHFLRSLNKKFSGLLERPWISSAVADVQSLPCFLNLCLNVCSPSQDLGDVYTEVLEAAYSLHRGPTDHKRSVGQQVSLSEVHNQLFSFAHIQRETVVLAPWCKSLYLIQVCGLIIVGNEAQNHSIISKFDNRCGSVRGHAVMCVERVEQGAQDTTLRGSYIQGDGVWGVLAYLHHLRSAGEEVLNPVAEWSV